MSVLVRIALELYQMESGTVEIDNGRTIIFSLGDFVQCHVILSMLLQ